MGAQEESILRGITDKDLKFVVRKAFSVGWKFDSMDGTTHARIVWPSTEEKVGFSMTPRGGKYYQYKAQEIEKISGIPIINRAKTGRIKYSTGHAAFINTRRTESGENTSRRIEELSEEYKSLYLQFAVVAHLGHATRTDIEKARKLVERMSVIEGVLKEMHQPVPIIEVSEGSSSDSSGK